LPSRDGFLSALFAYVIVCHVQMQIKREEELLRAPHIYYLYSLTPLTDCGGWEVWHWARDLGETPLTLFGLL